MRQVNLGRAARTDAGVHAAGNLVSIKMIINVPGVPDIVARINEELPPEIRVWSYVSRNVLLTVPHPNVCVASSTKLIQRTIVSSFISSERPESWNASNRSCDSRKYTYSFPTYLLIRPIPRARVNSSQEATADTHMLTASDVVRTTREDDLRRKRSWRISHEQLAQLREAANKFEGTHNFHNFTVGRAFTERSCERYIKKIEVKKMPVESLDYLR